MPVSAPPPPAKDNDPEFPDATAFAKSLVDKINSLPKITIDHADGVALYESRERLFKAVDLVGELMNNITNRKTIMEENKAWDGGYDTFGTRSKLNDALRLMHMREVQSQNAKAMVYEKITQMFHRFDTQVEEAQTMILDFINHGLVRYNKQYVELLNVRKRGMVKNLGLAAPFELRKSAAREWTGKFAPPKGLAEQFYDEFKERLPASEQAEATATERKLLGYPQGGKMKWVAWVAAELDSGPKDRLFPYMHAAELARQTYAPDTKPFSAVSTKFYQQQLISPHWYSQQWIENQLMKDSSDAVEQKRKRDKKMKGEVAEEEEEEEKEEEELTEEEKAVVTVTAESEGTHSEPVSKEDLMKLMEMGEQIPLRASVAVLLGREEEVYMEGPPTEEQAKEIPMYRTIDDEQVAQAQFIAEAEPESVLARAAAAEEEEEEEEEEEDDEKDWGIDKENWHLNQVL